MQGGKTYLEKCFCTQPFKVLDITEDKRSETLQLMLMSSSPGILDGDEYNITIDVAAQSSLRLQTQSYQRLFQMKGGASQCMNVHLANESLFWFLPHPCVPHEGSHFTSKNNVYIEGNCCLIWGEVVTCGRKLSGEVFQFSHYHNLTKIFLNGRLVVKENLLINPSVTDVTGMGQLEGYTHQASLLFLHEAAQIPQLIKELHQWLLLQDDICFGITTLPVNGLCVRIMGYKGEQLFTYLNAIAQRLSACTSVHKKTTTYA